MGAVNHKMKVLVDRNIEINAVIRTTVRVPHVINCGPRKQIIEVAQRNHFPTTRGDEGFRQAQLPWLATLCSLANHGKLEFYTSHEIQLEKLRQKGRSEGYLGINLFRDVPIKFIPCSVERSILIAPTGSVGVTEEEQMEFFRSIRHPRFLEIRTATGDAHVDDAFHLWEAERAGLDVFLTMDQRFWRVVKQKKKIINSAVRLMTPKELGEHLNAEPTDLERLVAETNPFS